MQEALVFPTVASIDASVAVNESEHSRQSRKNKHTNTGRSPHAPWPTGRPLVLTFLLGGEAGPLGRRAAHLIVGECAQPVGGVRPELPQAGSGPRPHVPSLWLAGGTGDALAGRAGLGELELVARMRGSGQ